MDFRKVLALFLVAASTLASSALPDDVAQGQARYPGIFVPSNAELEASLSDIIRASSARTSSNNEALIAPRATNDAPKSYKPAPVECPTKRPFIREGTALSPEERQWLPKRREETASHLRDLLRRIDIPGFDSDSYLRDSRNLQALPNVGIAVSGGGYRALLNGAGVLAAFDSRSDRSRSKNGLGGLLQSATYLSGLSGGAWLVGSLFSNNFTSVQDALRSPNIWRFETNVFGYTKTSDNFVDNLKRSAVAIGDRLGSIAEDVFQKELGPFPASITDFWGRALSYQLVDAPSGGPGFTFSSIATDRDFSSAKTPLPFIIADSRHPGEILIPANATIFEYSPWELGSFDVSINGFAPLKYLGSRFNKGELPKDEKCINGFDNVGFVMGTSSSLFNEILIRLDMGSNDSQHAGMPKIFILKLFKDVALQAIRRVINPILNRLSISTNWDVSIWSPNPFQDWNNGAISRSSRLMLVDGGEDGQNIPLYSHLPHDRAVDVVFAIDSSSDTTTQWPNGTSLVATYQYTRRSSSQRMGFPSVPTVNTFLNLGLNNRPTFFGCDAANLTSPSPLIVYLPNSPYVYASNISTLTSLTFTTSERDALVQNGWALATQLDSTIDADWHICVGCTMLARSFGRTRTPLPDACQKCFKRYCWDGTVDDSEPPRYAPEFMGAPIHV